MGLTKQTITDKIETVGVNSNSHYVLQVREAIQVPEDGNLLSQSFHRYVINPDHDVSTISDATVKAQFEAIMTDTVKANYANFLKEQAEYLKEQAEHWKKQEEQNKAYREQNKAS